MKYQKYEKDIQDRKLIAYGFPAIGDPSPTPLEFDINSDITFHRENNLPALCYDRRYDFWVNGVNTRLNGPAFYDEASDHYLWIIYDKIVNTNIEYFDFLEESGIDINNITDEDKVIIAIHWGT